MGLLEDKKTAAALIIRKMANPESSDYDSMKSSNEEMRQVSMQDGAEVDSSVGRNAAIDEMMRAVELKSASKFKMALDSYLQMFLDERDID